MKHLFICILLLASLHTTDFKYKGYETSDTNYVTGQILLPDYVHPDTLVVVNADSLNWCMENYDATCDGDILDILNAFCKPLK